MANGSSLDQLLELLADKDWRINHLYHIVDKNGDLVVFKRNAAQADFAKNKWYRNIILKVRQLGITTDASIDHLDEAIFNPNTNCVIIAHEWDAMKKIFTKIDIAWKHMDQGLLDVIGVQSIEKSTTHIKFNNGSQVRVALSSRSDTVHKLHVSEFGKICKKYPHKADEIVTGAFESVPANGTITIESTAEGEGGYFYDMFWEAWERGRDPRDSEEYKAFFYSYTWNKEYRKDPSILEEMPEHLKEYQEKMGITDEQMAWYYLKYKTLAKREHKNLMKQEYPSSPEEAFLASGRKVFDSDLVEVMLKDCPDPKRIVGEWKYYDEYNPRHKYAIGADVAEGVGLDSCTASVIDFTCSPPRVVATYKNKWIDPTTFAHVLAKAGEMYGGCLIAPERNNNGIATVAKLKDLYYNIYVQEKFDRHELIKDKRLGWLTTSGSKAKMMLDIKEALEEGNIDIPDRTILREARMFDHADLPISKIDEETTRHFDLLTATAIAYQMLTEVGTGENHTSVEPVTREFSNSLDKYRPV